MICSQCNHVFVPSERSYPQLAIVVRRPLTDRWYGNVMCPRCGTLNVTSPKTITQENAARRM